MSKKHKHHLVEVSHETYELLQQVKKIFASFPGEDSSDLSDTQVMDILVGGFLDSMVRGQDSGEHDHSGGCCGGSCCEESDEDKQSCTGICQC